MSCIMCSRSVLNSLSDPFATEVYLCYEGHFQCRKCTGLFAGLCGKCGGLCRVLRLDLPHEFLGKDQANEDEGDRTSKEDFSCSPRCKTMRDIFEMKLDPSSSVDSFEEAKLPKNSPSAAKKFEKMETIWEVPEIDFSDSTSSSKASSSSASDSPKIIAVMPKTLTIPEILAKSKHNIEEEKKKRLAKLSIQKLTSYCILPEEMETFDTATSPIACCSLETVVGLAVSEEMTSSTAIPCEKREDKYLEEAVPEKTKEYKDLEEAVSDSKPEVLYCTCESESEESENNSDGEEALPDSSDLSEPEPDADVSENEVIAFGPLSPPPSDEDLSDSELLESSSSYEAEEPIDAAATNSVVRRPLFTGPNWDGWHSIRPEYAQLSVSSKLLTPHQSIAYCPAPNCYVILCTESIIDHLYYHNPLWRMPSLELNQAMAFPIDLRRLTSHGTAKCLMVMMLKDVVFGLGDANYEQNLLPLLVMSMHVDLDDVVPKSCLHQFQTLVWVATLTGSVLPLEISFNLWPLAGGSPESGGVTYSGSARDMRSSLHPLELMKSSQVLSLNEDQVKGLSDNDTNKVGFQLYANMAAP